MLEGSCWQRYRLNFAQEPAAAGSQGAQGHGHRRIAFGIRSGEASEIEARWDDLASSLAALPQSSAADA